MATADDARKIEQRVIDSLIFAYSRGLLEFRPALVWNNVGSLDLGLGLWLGLGLVLVLGILHYCIPNRGETPRDPFEFNEFSESVTCHCVSVISGFSPYFLLID